MTDDKPVNMVLEYVVAREVVRMGAVNTAINSAAEAIMTNFGPKEVTYTINCMLCGQEITHTVTVAEAADYRDKPRGICGRCA